MGTPVPLLAPGAVQENIVSFTVSSETNTVFLGDSTVLASSGKGIPITNYQSFYDAGGTAGYDLAKLYIDGASGTVVNILYFTRYGG